MGRSLILALDFGTTSAKAALFEPSGRRVALFRRRLSLHLSPGGGAEQDPEEYLLAARALLARVRSETSPEGAVSCAGIACQRSTIVFWERASGRPLGPAVCWMDRRASPLVAALRSSADEVQRRSGLRLTPHYGGAHIARRLACEPALAEAARKGRVVAGPVASFVLSRIARGGEAACDPTLAQRMSLLDPSRCRWDERLCRLFRVPQACLPRVGSTSGLWGEIRLGPRAVPVLALAGDQQAAAAAFDLDGPVRAALAHYGTGAFVLWPRRGRVRPRGLLLSLRADATGRFYLEGTVNAAGAAMDAVGAWLGRSRLAASLRRLARLPATPAARDLPLLVPAFAGLGAPHWDASARPLLLPAEGAAGPDDLALAALAGIAHRVADILEAGRRSFSPNAPLILSGPLATLPALARFQSDLAGRDILRARESEATLRGVARIAARGVGQRMPGARAKLAARPRIPRIQREELRRAWRCALRSARSADLI